MFGFGKKKAGSKPAKKAKGKKFGGYLIKPDAKLGAVIGNSAVTPSQMTKKIWTYIKAHKLGNK